jgi:hypothetical protein
MRCDGAQKKVRGIETLHVWEMSTTYVHTRTAAPRYEIRGGPSGDVPCANVPHVTATLERLGAPRLSDAQVYAMVRDGGAVTRAATRLPGNLSVHKLTAGERRGRPPFRVTRTVELAGDSDETAAA